MVHIKRFSIAFGVVALWLLIGILAFGRLGDHLVWLALGLLAAIVLLDIHIRQIIRDSQRHAHS